ncbi:HEAT repeat domain-containing protein [Pyxidicoccus sp. 3LG]
MAWRARRGTHRRFQRHGPGAHARRRRAASRGPSHQCRGRRHVHPPGAGGRTCPGGRARQRAAALGRSLGFDAIPTSSARLADREERVREAVAVALGRLGGQQARQALEERLPLEEQPLVREALQRGLTLAEP